MSLEKLGAKVKSVWGSTLYHIEDLPYNAKEYLPQTYTQFKNKNEGVKVRFMPKTPGKGDLPFP
jgi:hypothetical protein